MEHKEFVGRKRETKSGFPVVDVDIKTTLNCICGKTSEVELDYNIARGYYDDIDIFLEVQCPKCKRRYELNVY